MIKDKIIKAIQEAIGVNDVHLETPEIEGHGDYSSNVAMQLFGKVKNEKTPKQVGSSHVAKSERGDKDGLNSLPSLSKARSPRELAEEIVKKLKKDKQLKEIVEKIEVAGPGFINFWLTGSVLVSNMKEVLKEKEKFGKSSLLKGKKIMVEYAHPNTHKEMHIGHMRTLIVGESLARLFETADAKVFRANYQGDIGPHVAKAVWGVQKLLEEKKMSLNDVDMQSLSERARLLGQGYVYANKNYEDNKEEIDKLNKNLYGKGPKVFAIYNKTREWSLDYFDSLYKRFGTRFDRLFFESEAAEPGKKVVEENVGNVFTKSDGAIVFEGERYGLHTRVFVTSDGNPTYEGKEMGLAPIQYEEFPFTKIIHVVGSDQKGYFQVVIKALEKLYDYMKDKQYHLPMGMVSLVGMKMSSRTGVLITIEGLLDEVKELIMPIIEKSGLGKKEKEEALEMIAIGAVKYSMLRSGATSNVKLEPKKSVSLDGDSGPYLQYTYARTQSVLRKFEALNPKHETNSNDQNLAYKSKGISNLENSNLKIVSNFDIRISNLNNEELAVLRSFVHFSEVVEEAAKNYAPNLVCNYLFDLAQKYNAFYARHKILIHNNERSESEALRDDKHGILEQRTKNSTSPRLRGASKEQSEFRLALTAATGQILRNGLYLLGIKTPRRM